MGRRERGAGGGGEGVVVVMMNDGGGVAEVEEGTRKTEEGIYINVNIYQCEYEGALSFTTNTCAY